MHSAVVAHRNMINGSLHPGEVSESALSIHVDGRQGSNSILRSVEHGMISFPYRLHPHEELILQKKNIAGIVGFNRVVPLLPNVFSHVMSGCRAMCDVDHAEEYECRCHN